jgi:hypothetical protein
MLLVWQLECISVTSKLIGINCELVQLTQHRVANIHLNIILVSIPRSYVVCFRILEHKCIVGIYFEF